MKKMLSQDTDRESAWRQVDALRRMGIAGRAAMVFELSDNYEVDCCGWDSASASGI